jgi:hypothetical protein
MIKFLRSFKNIIFQVKEQKITNNRKLIIYDPIPRVKISPCL